MGVGNIAAVGLSPILRSVLLLSLPGGQLVLGFCCGQSLSSKSADVGEVWRTYDERLQLVQACDALALDWALVTCDVHGGLRAWSAAAEYALASASVRKRHTLPVPF